MESMGSSVLSMAEGVWIGRCGERYMYGGVCQFCSDIPNFHASPFPAVSYSHTYSLYTHRYNRVTAQDVPPF
jgi:hypothetical protein